MTFQARSSNAMQCLPYSLKHYLGALSLHVGRLANVMWPFHKGAQATWTLLEQVPLQELQLTELIERDLWILQIQFCHTCIWKGIQMIAGPSYSQPLKASQLSLKISWIRDNKPCLLALCLNSPPSVSMNIIKYFFFYTPNWFGLSCNTWELDDIPSINQHNKVQLPFPYFSLKAMIWNFRYAIHYLEN